jgi:hypothetical protein
MKKLLITYSIVALILFSVGVCGMLQSCSDPYYKEVDGRRIEVIDYTSSYIMRYVEFDGHEYIYFQRGHQGSLCHSPKCHCLTEYKK